MDIGTADAEASFDKGVLPAGPDGEIGIRIGDIVKIPANKGGMRAFVQFRTYLFSLVSSQAECMAELFGDGAGGHKDAVIDILDDLDAPSHLRPRRSLPTPRRRAVQLPARWQTPITRFRSQESE